MTQAANLKTGHVIGAPVTVGSLAAATATILDAAEAGIGGYVCIANVHMVTTAKTDRRLLAIMKDALWVTSAGMPLVWALRAQGHAEAKRVAGPDLMLRLMSEAEKRSCRSIFSVALRRRPRR